MSSAIASLTSLREQAQNARVGVASEAMSVDAARSALGRCDTSHGALLTQVASLMRATSEACDGVTAVRRRVLACQDYAAAHPLLSLHADGSVSTHLEAGGGMPDAPDSASKTAEAQAQAAELEAMVTATLTHANHVDQAFASSLNALATPDPKPGPTPIPPSPDNPGPPRDSPNRSRYGRSRQGEEQEDKSTTTQGGNTGLHKPPIPGEHADMPGVTPWQYQGDSKDEGSGKYAQRPPTAKDYAVHEAATTAAGLFRLVWPDASRNLLHYLENTGEPQQINVNRMMKDMPELDDNTQRDVKDLANQAKNDAISSGASGPVTYTFSTAWKSEYADQKEHPNWFYATGGYQRATEGTVTVYPPTEGNPEWTYKYNYRVHVADRYNWDAKKATKIGDLTITDKELQELHQSGLAQEYDLIGESSVVSGP
ncbi:hypothetical protein [Actinomyces bowdenii]|uniref:hypothetical protein n=1 Tax=Actinomyces bowdenii TaxID=131109 RepID=UPI001FD19720|nr:hypothetical protein [Actinomyces bowdenii]